MTVGEQNAIRWEARDVLMRQGHSVGSELPYDQRRQLLPVLLDLLQNGRVWIDHVDSHRCTPNSLISFVSEQRSWISLTCCNVEVCESPYHQPHHGKHGEEAQSELDAVVHGRP